MNALWDMGAATTREVHSRVGDPAGLAYTTTATVLDRLHDKGCCSRQRLGKSFTYRAEITRHDVDRARAQDTIKQLIGGDPMPAIASLVDAVASLDPALLDELDRVTTARLRLREREEEAAAAAAPPA
jgi:BlaI family transcriptional regulator, penicillinase repressor